MYDSFAVLFITLAQPAHPGSGEGRFDNSLQRNVVTSHPYMQSSGLKGAMKRGARSRGMTSTLVETIFGPDAPTASSAIALSDAQVLFFPVAASGNGTFLWTTSPSVLAELAVDLSYVEAGSGVVHAAVEGVATTSLQAGAEVGALWPNGCPSVVQGKLYARDRAIVAAAANGGAQAQLGTLTSAIGGWALGHSAYFKGCFATQTAVVSDEAFKRFTLSATQVETHVALGHSGTVENGPWDVEYLPRLTVLYSVVAFRSGSNQTAANLLQELEMQIAGRMRFTQVGGDATIGRGICRLKLVGTAEIVNWKQVSPMLARKRWVHAATCVREVPGGKIGEYVGVVQRLPSQLQRTGLGKTLERLEKEKEGSAQRLAAQHVAAWLIGPDAPIGWGSEGDLRTRLLAADDIVFGQAEDEAGEIVSWLKEAARARQAALARATGAAADGGEQ